MSNEWTIYTFTKSDIDIFAENQVNLCVVQIGQKELLTSYETLNVFIF